MAECDTISVELIEETIGVKNVEEIVDVKVDCVSINYSGKTAQVEDIIEAGEGISALKVLRNDATDKAFIADVSDIAEINRIIGISKTAAIIGNSVEYVISGSLTDVLWSWDVTKPIFFDSNGDLTQTPPVAGFSMIVAIPITSTTINVTIKQGIKLVDDHRRIFKAPATVTLNTGTSSSTVSDLQTLNDGNTYDLAEAASTPGMNLEINFTSVDSVKGFAIKAYYVGSSTHYVEVQIWNDTTSAWDVFVTLLSGLGMNYRYIEIPDFDADYIDGSGNTIIRLYHPTSGNASHDLYIDYVALLG